VAGLACLALVVSFVAQGGDSDMGSAGRAPRGALELAIGSMSGGLAQGLEGVTTKLAEGDAETAAPAPEADPLAAQAADEQENLPTPAPVGDMPDDIKAHMSTIEGIKKEGDVPEVNVNVTMTDEIKKLIEGMQAAKDEDPLKSLNVSSLLPPVAPEIAASVKIAKDEAAADAKKDKASTKKSSR